MSALTHDEAVERLRCELEKFNGRHRKFQILSNVRWAAVDGFPECAPIFDVLVFDADRPAKLLPDGTAIGWSPSAIAAFDVIDRDQGYEEEYYDKPDNLILSGLQQYVLWDPSGEVMRPSLMIGEKWDGGWRTISTASSGVLFSILGCRLDFSPDDVVASPCGSRWSEIKLFNLIRVRESKLQDPAALEKLDRKIQELKAKLSEYESDIPFESEGTDSNE